MRVCKLQTLGLGAVLGLTLTACAPTNSISTPAADKAVAANTALVASPNRTPIQAAWWQRFNDPLMTELIQEAWRANPDITTAQANVRSARAQGVIAGANLLPTVSSSGSIRNTKAAGTSLTAGLDASWELDFFGANRAASNAAKSDYQAAQASYDDVKASLAAEVASAYVNLRLAQAKVSATRQSTKSRQETTNLTQLREKAGLTSGLEVAQANLSLGQAQAQIPALEGAVTRAQYALSVLTGKPPQALQTRLAAAKPIPTAVGRITPTIPANAIRQRPDMRAAEYKIAAAASRVGEAKANLYPSFSLGGSLSSSGLNLGDLLDPSAIARSLLASITAPIFNGGKLRQQVVVRDAAYDQAVASYQKTLLGALQDIANAFATIDTVQKQQGLLGQNLKMARNAENLARLSFNAGVADFQNVLDAQRSVLSAQDSIISSQADYSLALISLYKAVGGAW